MKAMLLEKICDLSTEREPLRLAELPLPEPGPCEVRLRVLVCGVCHTELDEIEGRTPPPVYPVVPGHQVVGVIDKIGAGVPAMRLGERVGVAWIFSACGNCRWCREGLENLCPDYRATGRDADGGYAEYMLVPAAYAVALPDSLDEVAAAPLLCAGAVGYRSWKLARAAADTGPLGLTGFGASGHLVLQLARYQDPERPVYVFARNEHERRFALELGASWAGDTEDEPPELLAAIIDTTPAWKPVLAALKGLAPGGRLVINAIRKEDRDRDLLAELDYPSQLWQEKELKSVANVTRQDVVEFLRLAAAIPLRPICREYPLAEANRALLELKEGNIRGAKVLRIGE